MTLVKHPVNGVPFQPGDTVRVMDIVDDMGDGDMMGLIGVVEYLDYECGCGQSYPDDPMIGVSDEDVHGEFWQEELELIEGVSEK